MVVAFTKSDSNMVGPCFMVTNHPVDDIRKCWDFESMAILVEFSEFMNFL